MNQPNLAYTSDNPKLDYRVIIRKILNGNFGYIFGRFYIFRIYYSRYKSIKQYFQNKNDKALNFDTQILKSSNLNIQEISNYINNNSYYDQLQLNQQSVASIVEAAKTKNLIVPANSLSFIYDEYQDKIKPYHKIAMAHVDQPLEIKEVYELRYDSYLLEISSQYLSHIPQTQTIVKSVASQVSPKIDFTVKNAISSLDSSLKSLDTDYIDNILFHGYSWENESNDTFEVIEFLEEQKKSGKIKNYGFATSESLELLDNFFTYKNIKPDLLQIACGCIGKDNNIILQKLADKDIKIVMYSPFRLEPSIPFIFEQLSAKSLIPEFESILERKVHKKEDMYEIILSYFQTVYSPYAIVISMFNSTHIEKNQQAIQERKISKEQFNSLEKLLFINKIF